VIPRRALAVSALGAVLLGGGACAAPQPAGRADINDPGTAPSVSASPSAVGPAGPLTGVPVDPPANAARQAVVVPVRVGGGSPPPDGLGAADLLFQEYAESGSMRLLAMYQSKDAPRIGPVHEIRPADVKVLPVFRPFVAYGGGPESFVTQLTNSDLPAVSRTSRADLFPDGYTATTALYPLVPAGGSAPTPMFAYAGPGDQLAKVDVAPAKQLSVTAPGRPAQVWQYDSASGTWRGDVGGVAVSVSTVVVLTMEYKTLSVKNPSPHEVYSAQPVGEGDAVAVSGGSWAKGRWSKPGLKMVCNIVDGTKTAMHPRPGPAWIVFAPTGSAVVVT
jgi:hypothetical protein